MLYIYVVLSSLLFYRSGAHRDLHSFPTRRSSDLEEPRVEAGIERVNHGIEPRHGVMRLDHLGRVAEQDRKSTRLNSSHVEISYAVFCLKKKKQLTPSIMLMTAATSISDYTLASYA